jgi:hypothetical protein
MQLSKLFSSGHTSWHFFSNRHPVLYSTKSMNTAYCYRMITNATEIIKKQYNGFGKVWMPPTMNLLSCQEQGIVKTL